VERNANILLATGGEGRKGIPSLAAVLLLNAEKMVDSFTKKNKQIPYHLNMTIL